MPISVVSIRLAATEYNVELRRQMNLNLQGLLQHTEFRRFVTHPSFIPHFIERGQHTISLSTSGKLVRKNESICNNMAIKSHAIVIVIVAMGWDNVSMELRPETGLLSVPR
jgi:hypothetical protein